MKLKYFKILFLTIFFVKSVSAAIVLDKVSLVFLGNQREAVVGLMNSDSTPTLVQSWVSVDNKKSKDFVVTPPLFRLEGKATADLRIVKMNQNLPQDRESLYTLNVKGVPPNDPNLQNTLSFAINSRIKIIYRPDSLNNGNVDSAYKKLNFTVHNKQLIIKNPTPYYISLLTLTLGNETIKTKGYIAPFAEESYPINDPITKYEVRWQSGRQGSEEQVKLIR